MQAESFKKILAAAEAQMLESTIQDNLSVNEIISLYMIDRLNEPTIVEFSKRMQISQSNATYIIRKLINKGYLQKRQHADDRREYQLLTTDKFSVTIDYASNLIERLSEDVLPHMEASERIELGSLLDNMEILKEKPAA